MEDRDADEEIEELPRSELLSANPSNEKKRRNSFAVSDPDSRAADGGECEFGISVAALIAATNIARAPGATESCYTAASTLMYSNNNWVENQVPEAQIWMQQGADSIVHKPISNRGFC
ncbi:hypothetical protein C8R45DRAFT_1079845 [Mycena sanguinolenta]|nr:hypothetical protein C8R45DRAFT_1079845 [Mycena sanguinolenta]